MSEQRTLTSINIRKCLLQTSESHNQRRIKVSNSREDLQEKNISKIYRTIKECYNEDKQIFESVHNKKFQRNYVPIKEGILVTNENTLPQDVERFCDMCYKEFGIKAIQYYMHNDEGHYDRVTNEWITNYHTHIVFDYLCKEHRLVKRYYKKTKTFEDVDGYGCILQLMKSGYRKMQDLAAEATGMKRGIPGRGSHLSGIQYTYKKTQENLFLSKEDLVKINAEIEIKKGESIQLTEQLQKAESLSLSMKEMISDTIATLANNLVVTLNDALKYLPLPQFQKERETFLSLKEMNVITPSTFSDLLLKQNLSNISAACSVLRQVATNMEPYYNERLIELKSEVDNYERESESYKYLPEQLGLSPRVRKLEYTVDTLTRQLKTMTDNNSHLQEQKVALINECTRLRQENLDYTRQCDSRFGNIAKLLVEFCPEDVIEKMKVSGLEQSIGAFNLSLAEKQLQKNIDHNVSLKF